MVRSSKYPPGVGRRKNGTYRARVSWEGEQVELGTFYSVTEAKAAASKARLEVIMGTFIPPVERKRLLKAAAAKKRQHALTVAQWSEVWLQQLEAQGKTAGTLATYRSGLRVHILPALGSARLVEVTSAQIDKALTIARDNGGNYANLARTLKSMFRAAVEHPDTGLTESPVKVTVQKQSLDKQRSEVRSKYVDPDGVRELTALMPEPLAVAVPLAAWLGLRLGEVLGLQRQDFIDLETPEKAYLTIQRQWNTKSSPPDYSDPKAGSARDLAIPASLVRVITAHLSRFVEGDPASPVVTSTQNPAKPVSQTSFDKAWRAARDQVRPGLRFHDLRHTALTIFSRATGATLDEIKRRGGHRSTEVAMGYQQSDLERERQLVARLDELIGGSDD